MSVRLVQITDGGEAVGPSPPRWNIDIQITDVNGLPIEEEADVLIQAFNIDDGAALFAAADALLHVPSSGGAGTIPNGTNGPLIVARSSATGLINCQLEDVQDASIRSLVVVTYQDDFAASGNCELRVTF